MSDHNEFQSIIARVLNADDPVRELRSLVLSSGGHWSDITENALFEISFLQRRLRHGLILPHPES